MKGSETFMLRFMEGADNRYVIPVYQRTYDWKIANCRQLWDDLKKVVFNGLDSHFFGSIVSSVAGNGSKTEYHIIDGQQRLTTVSLLLLAMSKLVAQGKIVSHEHNLDEQIRKRYLINPWAQDADDQIKLKPVKSDRAALEKLFGPEEDFDRSSNLTINYQYFCDVLLKKEVPIDDLYAAIGRLEIICITLDHGDNAQLIFESLNSTGLALTEGDKIKNYILMGCSPKEQDHYYNDFWTKIEKCTGGDVSGFVRDYLSIKTQITPTINAVYRAFKDYAENACLPIETLLDDLRVYAHYFEKLRICKSGLGEQRLDDCLYRMARLDIVVTRPFLMEVLRLNQENKLSVDDVLHIFLVTENYLFRRNICEVPTNALNKIFLTLNKDIRRYDKSVNDYVDKFIYTLLSKRESGRFPNDEEFKAALYTKQVYLMRGKYKAYLFERFENYGTKETKDVFTHLDNNVYTIEHIMPQHLTAEWIEALGTNYAEIHETWLHRLANLTLTGYNPNLSNRSFKEKRDAEVGGYKNSGLRMNQKIATKDSWGLPELEERNREMLTRAVKIWEYPTSAFKPAEKTFDSYSLDDEAVEFTRRELVKYSFRNVEQPVGSWTEMFEQVVKYLHQLDKSVLTGLAYSESGATALASAVSSSEGGLRSAFKIDENVYVEKNTSTVSKLTLLRRLFAMYDADPMDLVFYLKDIPDVEPSDEDRYKLRFHYWTYALPLIQKENLRWGTFGSANPTISNTEDGYFGVGGFCISCAANYDFARVELYLGKGEASQNKVAFDLLLSHKPEIEAELGVPLNWDRLNGSKASSIFYTLQDISITNKDDWPRMAEFHAEWSSKFCRVFIPYLKDTNEKSMRLDTIAGLLREWAYSRDGVQINLAKCVRTYTRFTTETMSSILPDITDAPSGWNTNNHYFYEIMNGDGAHVHIQLCLSARNATPEFLTICDRINTFYPARTKKTTWQWRVPFKTSNVELGAELASEELFVQLDECLEEIWAFEADLKEKMGTINELR